MNMQEYALKMENAKLINQNKRYREALEEIAYHVAIPIGEKEDYEKTAYELIDIAKRAIGY